MEREAEVRPLVSCYPDSSAGSRLQPGQLRLFCPIPSSHPLDFLGHRRLYSTASLPSAYNSRLGFSSADQTTTTGQGRGRHYEASSASSSTAGSIEGRCQNLPHDTPKVKGNLVRKRKAAVEDDAMDYGLLQTRHGSAENEEKDFTRAIGSSARVRTHYPDDLKDETYWKRRRKNNEAAKRSRDARRAREGEMAMRASMLEDENLRLRAQVALLTNESHRLYCRLYSGFGLL